MYVTDDKVFLHMVKSAGISVHVALMNSKQKIHVNQRHASINHLPECYSHLPRYGIIREPHKWYQSFYKFFLNVEGYMSFMLMDPLLPDDEGIIYLESIDFNEFVRRSINLEKTLIKYPNKARVFNNILRTQGNIHFVNGYFTEAIDIDKDNNIGDFGTLEQFNVSLYEWFYRGCGMHTSTNIPMNKLQDIETLFNIKMLHKNKTNRPNVDVTYDEETLQLVKDTHSKFYDEYNNYKGLK